jgi:serine/threonine-protein kinase
MNPFSSNLSNFHSDVLQHNYLGQLCGAQQLFCDRYQVSRILGRGGFGITFLARDMSLPGYPRCVIKQLCPKVNNPLTQAKSRQRFEQEAKTLRQLGSHPQIPQLLDYFEANGEFYLVQEYIRGFTLAREVRRLGRLSEAAVKQFLRELLPLLQYVHNHQVIHRDIKPQNLIRCDDDGRLVLIDFGAVKELFVQTGEAPHKTATTHFVGTMGFAPPEQFSLRPVYGSDLYAVGVTCVYLLTGKAPLEFDQDPITGEICWQNQVKLNLSDHFAHVLGKMLKIPLDERFKSANEVMSVLGLEPYVESLTRCLSTQRLRGQELGNQEDIAYLPPVARTAIAIREWKAKLKARSQSSSGKVKRLLASTGGVS